MTQPNDKSLQFMCPQCVAPLKAPMVLAGTRCRCPRCQFVFQTPTESYRPPSGDPYGLRDASAAEPFGPSGEISVACSLCHTQMSATVDQIGQTLICPDCGRPAVVPPPAPPPKASVAPTVVETYALHGETSSANAETHDESLIRVYCPRCGTIMYAAEDQVGSSLICPDCHTSAVVPSASAFRKRIDVAAEAGPAYGLAVEREPQASEPEQPSSPGSPPPRVQAVRARARRQFEPYFRHPRLPRNPFLSGTFSFPFSAGARGVVLIATAWAILTFGVASLSFEQAAIRNVGSLFGSVLLAIGAGILGVSLFAFVATSGLVIVRDTAAGCHRIYEWPGAAFLEWFLEPFYVVNSFCAAVLPGLGIAWLLTQSDLPADAAVPASLFLLFPVAFLSTLETFSMFGVLSWPVCRTFWQAWPGWAAFYLSAAALLFVAIGLSVQVFVAEGAWGIIVAAPLLTAAWFVYCRLLGRLAWYCTDRARKMAEAAETAEDPNQAPEEEPNA